jgi:tetratricopeptide (TPR) repeat protein
MGRWAAILALLWALPAGAADLEKAKEHFKAGLSAFTLGDFAKAASEYEAAYAIEPDPALLYNAAQAHRLAGNKQRALFLYQNYLRYFPKVPNRAEVQKHVDNLQAAIASEKQATTTPPTTPMATGPQPAPVEPAPAPVEPAPVASPPAQTAPAPNAADQAIHAAPEPKKKRTPKWVWGVVGGVAAAAAIALGVGLGIGLSGSSYPSADIGSGHLK